MTRFSFDKSGDHVRIDGYCESVIVRMNDDSDLEVVAVDEGGAAFDAVPVQSLMVADSPLPLDVLREAVAAWSDQFDGAPDTDLNVSGCDLVDWFSEWRERAKQAVASAEA